MKHRFTFRISLSFLLAIGLLGGLLGGTQAVLTARDAAAAGCYDWTAIFEANRSIFSKADAKKKVLILTFVNKADDPQKEWLGDALRLGLYLMLEPAKDSDVIELRTDQTSFETADMVLLGRQHGADYVVGGEYRDSEGQVTIYARYVDVSAEETIKLEEEKVEWPNPQKFSELLIHMARRASKFFKKVRVDKKSLKQSPLLARSTESLKFWTLAQLADEKTDPQMIQKAHDLYLEAVKNDFNFCFGYMGMAQTFAELGFIKKLKGKPYRDEYLQAQRDLTKVILLCPETAKLWGRRVTQYLDADVFDTSGQEMKRSGDAAGARAQFEQAVTVLPGDVSALRALGDPRVQELTHCR